MAEYNTPDFTRYAAVHKNRNGPGDARPTALQIVKDNNLEGNIAELIPCSNQPQANISR